MNKVRDIRKVRGLTQSELALKAKTTQQQIQRIESGKHTARVDLAVAICAALEKPLEAVFPGATKAWKAIGNESEKTRNIPEAAFAVMRQVGIEADPRQYVLKVLLRDFQDPMYFEIANEDVKRVFGEIQEESADAGHCQFILFDTHDSRVALNLSRIVFCHFLWEAEKYLQVASDDNKSEGDEAESKEMVKIYFGANQKPVLVDFEYEQGDSAEDGADEYDYFNAAFSMLENYSQPNERFHIVDSNGEGLFIRAGDITALIVPLVGLDRAEWLTDEDDE